MVEEKKEIKEKKNNGKEEEPEIELELEMIVMTIRKVMEEK